MNTSVTMLSMPSMRLDVPNRDGFPDTADKTFWTNATSWIGSAQMGPPSCRKHRQTSAGALSENVQITNEQSTNA